MKKTFKTLLSLLMAIILSFSCAVYVVAEEADDKVDVVKIYGPDRIKAYLASLTIQIADTYYYGVSDEDLLYRALCSTIDLGKFDLDTAVSYMMRLLKDGYSEFYTPERFESLYNDISGEYYGIGVQIMLSGDHVVVAGVFPDSPAEKAGIKLYDTIVSVDGVDIAGMSTADVAALIKREKQAKVTIGIVRNGTPMFIDCFCDEVDQNPISYEIMEDGKIGYIYLSTFSLNMDEFLVPVLEEFKQKGIDDIILDIRNNGGGELNAAIALANHFIPDGVIAKLKYRNPENNTDLVITNGVEKSPYNMVLLVNGGSASASELFTGAVKDRDAGTVIGTKTYGKGSMQSIFRLITGSAVKYTVAEFHTPNDARIHTVGITPDYVVENSYQHITEESLTPLDLDEHGNTSSGKHVLAIEERLFALGCFEGVPDEVFDEETSEALRYFQMMRNLEITGQPDMFTLVSLVNIIYDFKIENDDQLEAAKKFLLTGSIN
ncbi:MAG: S41 family peptidase [Clostridia bacterium]|nr:S41 family peptidase [Clostridia bacterium]